MIGIIVIGIVCIACITGLFIFIVKDFMKNPGTDKQLAKVISAMGLYLIPTLLITCCMLCIGERDKSKYEQGYKAGIEQKWIMHTDTTYTPKLK